MRTLTHHEALALSVGYDPTAVRRHMELELRRAPRQSLLWPLLPYLTPVNRWLARDFRDVIVSPLLPFVGLAAAAALISGLASFVFDSDVVDDLFDGFRFLALALLVFEVTAAGIWLLSGFLQHVSLRGPAHWYELPLDVYLLGKPLCPRMLDGFPKALALMQPGSKAVVHVLMQNWKILDPVLEIRNASGSRFPLIWDEFGNPVELRPRI